MMLVKFAELQECPRRQNGCPLPLSSFSEHLKGWKERILKGKPSGMFSSLTVAFVFSILEGSSDY